MITCPACSHAFNPPGIKEPLTPKERLLLDFVSDYIGRNGYGPTYVEMGAAMSVGITTIHEHLTHIERKNWIVRYKHRARGIRVA